MHSKIKKNYILIMLLSILIQLILDYSFVNIASVFIVFISTVVTYHYVMKGNIFKLFPLLSWVIISFNFSTQSGALILQTLYLNPLIQLLDEPIYTFIYSAIFNGILILSLYIFIESNFLKLISYKLYKFNSKLNIFNLPNSKQLWFFGIFGLLSIIYKGLSVNITEYGDVGGKFIEGFIPFFSAPYLLLVIYKNKVSLVNKILLYGYTILLISIGILLNSRGTILTGVANAGLYYIFLLLTGSLEFPKVSALKLVLYLITLSLAVPLTTNLAVAMLVARLDRETSTAAQVFNRTIEVFTNPEIIEDYNKSIIASIGASEYSEKYIDNEIFNRFITTKYIDLSISNDSIYNSSSIKSSRDFLANKLFAILPTPLLPKRIDKNEVLMISFGDSNYLNASGFLIVGQKLGSVVGSVVGIGILSFLFLFPVFIIINIGLHSLEYIQKNYYPVVAIPIAFIIFPLYQLYCTDSIVDPIFFTIRTVPQTLLLYYLINILSNKILR